MDRLLFLNILIQRPYKGPFYMLKNEKKRLRSVVPSAFFVLVL